MTIVRYEREAIEVEPLNGYRCYQPGCRFIVLFGFLRLPLP